MPFGAHGAGYGVSDIFPRSRHPKVAKCSRSRPGAGKTHLLVFAFVLEDHQAILVHRLGRHFYNNQCPAFAWDRRYTRKGCDSVAGLRDSRAPTFSFALRCDFPGLVNMQRNA